MDLNGKIDALIGREGKFSNDANDKGNWYLGKLEGTMWGITAAVARSFGYTGPMNQLPRETAVAIYARRYWSGVKFDQVAMLDDRLAERLFDIGVNTGQATGVRFLQRALNTLNHGGKDFPDLTVDGGIGAITLGALKAYIGQRGQQGRDVLFFMVAAMHSVFYVESAEGRPANEDFEYGWQINRAMNGVRV
ncbi:glycoside hydrolase family 108 protein [Burkholderia cepacia]|uniref:glycoside hydrolase family 108 protein n=1 Tax=Burkholderia cepacia TaxID=292 RepID=UPI000758C932|nr:glycosyl hydrolase 108 family protein [Burkholderia cepacia]KWH57889.1 hypothetical protein WM00_10410 [Burkholderia cepacia]